MTAVGEDLVEKILLTLPPKTLVRFKCASKGWDALINNPRFVAKHLSNFNSNSKHLLVMKKTLVLKETTNDTGKEDKEEEEEVVVFSLLNICNNDDDIDTSEDRIIVSSVADVKIPLSMSLKTKEEAVHMVAHSNGIICLHLVKTFQVILWNPAIQEFKLLPPSPYLPDVDWRRWSYDYPKSVEGFGYDAKLNEDKVVNFGLSSTPGFEGDGYDIHNRPKAAIYSLSRSSFYDIMLPADRVYHPEVLTYRMTLRVWNESLALFILIDEFEVVDEFGSDELEYSSFVIWVLDELGGLTGASWTKHVTLEPTEKPLAFLNSNDILLDDFMGLVFGSHIYISRSLVDPSIQSLIFLQIL
ncbi:uncharacterized protein LOC126790844 [Argentina anserina]|uniref:uncharacterized protein LOC126790844 n=1 Tax=Argentina anserina TaxID=57926 RepID=UPI00217685D0|nr:uncharacterized protein LOC126790844 [Potentilla anserina]